MRALRPPLVDERDVGAEPVGVAASQLAAAGVGRDEHDLSVEHLAQVLLEHGHRGEVVDGVVEEALDLSGVEVDGHDPVGAGGGDEIGDEPRA